MAPEDDIARRDVILNRAAEFLRRRGRRPRILLARANTPDSDREMKRLSACFAGLGFDVDILGLVKSPRDAARTAVENDVHALGVVGVEADEGRLLIDIGEALISCGGQDILLAAWPRLSGKDTHLAVDSGRRRLALFGPVTETVDAAGAILDMLQRGR